MDDAVASLSPADPLCLLDSEGRLNEQEDLTLDLSTEELQDLYRLMTVTRRVDKESINLQRQGQLAVYASCLGQEGAQIGSAYALSDEDWVFPSYREHGAAIVRGLQPEVLLQVWRGTWLGWHDPHEKRFALQTIPIATHALHAVGFALGAQLDGSAIVSLVYFGDGATSEGDLHEALNFGSVYDVPAVFFCQNNQYAISVPVSRQARVGTLAHRAAGYGIPGVRVDGNDVLACYAVTMKALERARSGKGPSFIEAVTYRVEGHSTSDDPTRYRTREELEQWAKLDPLLRMELFLKSDGVWDDSFAQRVDDEANEYCARLREAIYDAPHPDPTELFEHVYVEAPPHFERQRKQLEAELSAEEEE
jgi:pyruvate dehydrogenase E1 component alpha subunit